MSTLGMVPISFLTNGYRQERGQVPLVPGNKTVWMRAHKQGCGTSGGAKCVGKWWVWALSGDKNISVNRGTHW